VPTSLTTCQSSHLVSTSSCVESPLPPRILSGEPLLSEMHQWSSPQCRAALAIIPDPPHRQPKSGRPPPPLLRAPTHPVFVWAAPAPDSLWATHHRRIRGPHRYCANRPRAEAGSLALFCFSKFSDLVQIIANFKNLHMIHLTSENYETNFVG
jgi:hypothetical protein